MASISRKPDYFGPLAKFGLKKGARLPISLVTAKGEKT